MANICDNKFYIFCEDEKITEQISNKLTDLFNDDLHGEITYEDESVIEGWFESKWRFTSELFDNFFDEFAEEGTIYMRCLSEEYGNDLVSMNVYSDGNWWKPQYFNL